MPLYVLPPMHEVLMAAVVDAKSQYIPAGLVTLQALEKAPRARTSGAADGSEQRHDRGRPSSERSDLLRSR
jgi:hypothetical protein